MCFNANISITTFIIGVASIIIGLINNTITYSFGLFYFSIVFMQFIEFLLWIYLNNDYVNNILSIFASILLKIQVLAIIFLLYFYKKILSIILIILVLIFYYLMYNHNNNYKTIINSHTKTLEWLFLHNKNKDIYITIFAYTILMTIILIMIYNYSNNNYYKLLLAIFIILNIITFIYCWWYYFTYNTHGSIYCLSLNIFSFIIVIVSIYKNYHLL